MSATQTLVRGLRGTVVPAVATPMDPRGVVDLGALRGYAERIAAARIGGVAVWAHTGRGLYLSEPDRADVLRVWRETVDGPIVAGVGVPRSVRATTLREAWDATVTMAVQAAGLGADAVMVYPLAQFAERPEGEREAVRLHERVAEACGLPVLGFFLHGEAGGYPYPPSLIRRLLALPSAVGVKLATLDRAMACQDAIRAAEGSGKLVVTGEDRMFGPSLMWGADSALVGIAAARVGLTTAVLDAWTAGDHTAFVRASGRLDRFAEATFTAPIEGYVQRMLWAAVWEGLLPESAAHDPYGPRLPESERTAVIRCLESLSEEKD
ncbi:MULTISPECIES: dihydrodipicolinate synthase family protein [unclassified Streptomyces]|uniref:dihydrodipicolinate synthase family protein n=1 Tax=unclassified Streptomyces TaxID=2593676 RepID=UPI0028C37AB1|nr:MULTISPECIES: dihydrodipicolinate synthase family protein [unclassified Streptomyces]WNO72336.1 dihydrodipicolinate synthase family protein [Streptomyces sp. AM8-1-1]